MKTVELGSTGQQVSRIALGAMGMGTAADDPTSFATLDRYVGEGGNFIDTADCYTWWNARGTSGGQSEELLARWFTRSSTRDQVFLATKASGRVSRVDLAWPADAAHANWDVARKHFVGASTAVLRESLEGSLRRLDTDRIDLYYIHVDDRATPLEETLEALASFVAEGKVRYIGWSNVRTWRLERIRALCEQNGWPAPVALQQQHTYLQRRAGLEHTSIPDDEQLDYLREHPDLTLVAYSPILQGLYDLPEGEREHHWHYPTFAGESAHARLAMVDAIASELGVHPGQVVLAWLVAQTSPKVIPLIGTTKVGRYTEAVAALDIELTPEQLAALDAA